MQIAKASESMTIPEISRLEGLSATHVAKLLMILRKGGFIKSTRGQAGGYTLSRPAEQIYVSDVLLELGTFDAATLEPALRALADARGIKPGVLIHATRVAVTGQGNSPGIFDVLELIGKDRVVARLRAAAS